MSDRDDTGLGRRGFLQLMGGAIAVPSLAACTRQPPEKIVPFVMSPEQLVPGRPLFYASATLRGGVATGVLVEAHMGRPTKIEGNPEHPASLGGTDAIQQAEVLSLYDPERSQTVMHNGQISSWSGFVGAMQAEMLSRRSQSGAGLCILTGESTSPTLQRQLAELRQAMPSARWFVHEPVGIGNVYAGTRMCFGWPYEVVYDLTNAGVVLCLEADILGTAEAPPRYTRDWAERRKRAARGEADMNRLYAVESGLSLTGANADHRVAMRATEIAGWLQSALWSSPIGKDLRQAGARGLVVAGRAMPPEVHAAAALINSELNSAAVRYLAPIRASASDAVGDIRQLASVLREGEVSLLVVACNAAYSGPADVDFAAAMRQAKLRVHLGAHFDETAALCHWHIPESHPLEAWSDATAYDGSQTVVQPLIEPLYVSKSIHELIAALGAAPDESGYELVRKTWRGRVEPFEPFWRELLHVGVYRAPAEPLELTPKISEAPPAEAEGEGLEIAFRPDPFIYDGRYANNAWLQELPKPISQLTWDNAAMIAPADAAPLGIETGDVVRLTLSSRSVEAPAYVLPGQAAGSVTVHLGYGRSRGGKIAKGGGFNAYALRSSHAPWQARGLTIEKIGASYDLAIAQPHPDMEGRDLIRSAAIGAYRDRPQLFAEHEHKRLDLYPDHAYEGYAWGMTIDLAACTGCSACVAACQSENNVPVVGKEEVLIGREMHWIRVDRYFAGSGARFQPVPCMHCEKAPCEVVCPVEATVHHDEGLNDMVYNRCVGTKYCSNNCPYKVRRFNFFGYAVEQLASFDATAPTVQMSHNPDVTVRSYGVMEKCSYCVQRINYARIEAKKDRRPIQDGEVMTACQAACPARAISFGDINDGSSEVSRRKAEPRNYAILAELNTEPRTTYLSHLWNPNPEIPNPEKGDG